ncbi:MAG TPA: dihydropteroate synthase [Burkholderiaceae bacterium]|nr:dihydropteroate synthase [Burkholderiaceae bacterium]
MISPLSESPGADVSAAAPNKWRCGSFSLPLDRVRIMGVLNVTPDSFSDGGRFVQLDAALLHARQMIDDGADIIDIGGESTRPGATPISPETEMQRVLPVLRALQGARVPISVDTSQPALMRAALEEGACIINDVRGFRTNQAVEAVRDSDCGLVVMHMQGEPASMQRQPVYDDVIAEVSSWLARRCDELALAGIARERMVVDPGFGFGKNHEHNRQLLASIGKLLSVGQPLLVGVSRKSTLGEITGKPAEQRLSASLAAALIAIEGGARIVRVHDVGATRDAIAVWEAVQAEQRPAPR